MAEKKSKVLIFHVYRGSSLIKTAELNDESVTIGSGPAALLSIDDKSLADLHAVVNVEEGGAVHLFDLGSEAGTKVNGNTISNTPLKDGDQITAGNVRITVQIKAATIGDSSDEFDEEEATHVQMSPLGGQDMGASGQGVLDHEEATDPGPAPEKAAPSARLPSEDKDEPTEEEPKTDEGAKQRTETPPVSAAQSAHNAASSDAHGDDHDDHDGPDEPAADFVSLLVRSNQNDPQGKGRSKVLEVSQVWGDAHLDEVTFPRGKNVTIGPSTLYKLRFLNIPLVPLPEGPALILQNVNEAGFFRSLSVPSEWASDFFVPPTLIPHDKEHVLAKWTGSQYVVQVLSKWDGFVDVGEKRYTFEQYVAEGKGKKTEMGFEIPVDDDTRVAVDLDGMVFFVQMVHPGRKAIASMTQGIDYPFVAIATVGAMMFFIMALLMLILPKAPQNEMVEIPDRYVELLMEKPEPEKKKGGNPDAGEGAKAKKEEGKVGKKDAKMEKAKGDKVKMQKQEIDRQVVDQAGVMGALQDDALSQTLGASGLSSDIQGGIGGLIGAKGSQIGSGGLGARGSGIGGGGTAEGLGGLGTKGIGSGSSGYGSGGGSFGTKGEGGIAGVGGDPIILGALDRSLIDEVIKRHMNQIRYCYQRELTKNASLGGKIVIKFTIAKDGTVSSATTKQTTMNNQAVEQCIEGRFMRMVFPEPKGGGIVIVSYPFIFSPG